MLNKKKIIIVGAGDLGQEIETWMDLEPQENRNWEIIGFLDDDLNALSNSKSKNKIIGRLDEFHYSSDNYVIIAIADCMLKADIFEKFIKDKVKLFTFVSSRSIIGKNVVIGEGTLICPNVIISNNVVLQELITINLASQIGHDSFIGKYSSLMANITIGGNCKILDKVFIGSGTTVIPDRSIISETKIGAGSVIYYNIKSKGTYIGNPAKKI